VPGRGGARVQKPDVEPAVFLGHAGDEAVDRRLRSRRTRPRRPRVRSRDYCPAFARTREQIIPIALSVVFLLAALGGLWWPFYDWLQAVARGAMTTWSMFAIQDVMLRDKGLIEVAPTLLLLIAYGVVSFGIGLRVFRYGARGDS
jgi:hypothetical protein